MLLQNQLLLLRRKTFISRNERRCELREFSQRDFKLKLNFRKPIASTKPVSLQAQPVLTVAIVE